MQRGTSAPTLEHVFFITEAMLVVGPGLHAILLQHCSMVEFYSEVTFNTS